ncbi:uncharacterized protein LOC111616408 [Centruroides sculpturatus]|uniref:uncharacterized protein LOC111616408 n=1 Tax=Centruroides sculpturatus TaxID=218467 RepID=UPI000C6E5598|nr:uncharacterized protein LOC111616408 [Centruroides sculpturatus]
MQFYPSLLHKLDSWTLCGLGYSLPVLFYLKYFVIYGIAGLFAQVEQFTFPPPPKCISRIHLSSYQWSVVLKKEIIAKYENGIRVSNITKKYNVAAKVAKGVNVISKQRSKVLDEVEKLLLIWINEKQLAVDSEMDLSLRCLLLMDNVPSHPPNLEDDLDSEHDFIKIKFLPPNTTPLLQPMDQQVISNFKKLYIYYPVVGYGKRKSIFKVFGCFLCFAFVCIWHGMGKSICVWSLLSFLGVVVEKFSSEINSKTFRKVKILLFILIYTYI